MESETNENNNDIHKVDIHQHIEPDLNKSNDKSETASLQQKSGSSDDDQDIVTPPTHQSESLNNEAVSSEVVLSEPGLSKVQNGSHGDGHVHQNKNHEEHRKEMEPHVQESPAGNRDGKLRSTDGLTYEPSDNDSEPEGEYNFTEDQKRAMMELMVQKHEDGDIIDEDPPEYNVKGRLILLNAELANDPIPIEGNRETKVGFKPEIVDLVAPPPSYFSDDESQPDSGRSDKQKPSDKETPSPGTDIPQKSPEQKEGLKKQESYVVERDGNFSVLSAKELTPSEYELYASKEDKDKNNKSSNEGSGQRRKLSDDKIVTQGHGSQATVAPRPPSKPRPTTAVTGPRRATGQSARPKSAAPIPQHDTSSIHSFEYDSPYALTKEQKDEAKKEAKRLEEEKREQERRKREEEEEKQKESMSAYQAWLKKKKEEEKNKKQESELDDEQRKEEREAAYKTWLREKHAQGKKEKLLRRRQQQERCGSCVIRTQEDCDKAFNEWLKRKNLEKKKQLALDKQKCKIFKLYQRRSKRTLALLKALKVQSGSPYLDYYGYRV